VIEQEWERVTLEEINEWIDEVPRLMNEVCETRRETNCIVVRRSTR
jgi:hypothetical protein